MNLKQVILNNTGMQQDLSISKEGKDFAYKNLNIRIQATGDGTLASITNIKSPKRLQVSTLVGVVLNSILCNKYIIVFTHSTEYDYIYRIDLEDSCKVNTLYKGNLNFHTNQPIDSTFYYENDKVQKIYWVDGWTSNGSNNYPRVINIITEGERNGSDFTPYSANTNFDFYPQIGNVVPQITATKNFNVASELPAGTIQYFVSYFNHNRSETLIVGQSFLYSVDLKTRGAKADETGCAFDITISNIDSTNFDYIRLYSVRRTSLNGEIVVSIVSDIKLVENTSTYTLQDNGIGQETLDSSKIFFVGGTPLFAKTLCQKDGTLFIGGLKTEGILISDSLKATIANTIQDNDGIKEAGLLTESTKKIPTSDVSFNAYYPYKLQKDNESIDTKTFKVGEIYRFGIQFQNKQGQWSEVVWIGDKKIENHPTYNNTDNAFNVSNIVLDAAHRQQFASVFTQAQQEGFVNYRLVMADPETSNGRSILAQGVINPTMFVPSLRTLNAPHTISSWIMRPRGGTAPYHHLEPLTAACFKGSELASYDPKETIAGTSSLYHTMPFEFIKSGSSDYTKTSNDTNFYIDESILTLNSPDIGEDTTIKGTPELRLIGYLPITSNYSDAEVILKNIGLELDYTPDIYKNILASHRVTDQSLIAINPLYSDYMYLAPKWRLEHELLSTDAALYNLHMWHFSKSIVGFNIEEDGIIYPDPNNEETKQLSEEPLVLGKNVFYNHLFSKSTVYLNSSYSYPLSFGVGLYSGVDDSFISFKDNGTSSYAGSLSYLHTNSSSKIYSIPEKSSESRPAQKNIKMSCAINFMGTAHAVFYLGERDSKLQLLPVFNDETPYSGIFTGKYPVYGNTSEIPALWRDLNTGTLTSQESNIKNLFNKNIDSVGLKLGASWIDNFAIYENSTDVSKVYDRVTSNYKMCCVISTSVSQGESFENKFRTLIRNAYSNKILTNYNYTEQIDNVACTVLMAYDNGGNLFKKCYWSNIDNINVVEINDNELNKAYPYLYSVMFNYVDVWEGRSPLPSSWKYKFVYPYKEYDVYSDMWITKGEVKDLDAFPTFSGEYIYNQDIIPEPAPSNPYLFIGELYYNIAYSDLYGGYNQEALDKLTWMPVSKSTPLTSTVDKTEGDTYYQRWDCLKTYPKTEEDINQVIDITSFMVETHINLDERTDKYRATFNTVVRPLNFNLFNTAYNQKNNLFSYTTVNALLSEENSHQVAWSMTKNILGTVDTWTNISASNVVNLKYPVTKLVNFNNKVVGLTEHSVEVINFNARNLVPTEDNTFIELKNSSKVDGTIDFTLDNGTTNPSILITETGLYFINDNENSLMKINYSGEIQNLGISRMDSWFKNNIKLGNHIANHKALHFSYDSKYKDVYIGNEDSVIVYNELLNNFTSFVDLQELVSLHTFKGNTYAIATYPNDVKNNSLYEMYTGYDYGHGFNNKDLPYSIQYRVNPGPYSDKVFTNIEFRADLGVSSENKSTSNAQPFDTIKAWTEYQDTGIQPLVYDRLYNLREKFRTWRALIPRNEHTRDRIRNPWMHLKLDKPNVNGQKLEFHNITVTYME